MPKIDVRQNLFFEQLGHHYTTDELEKIFPAAKAELDEPADMTKPEELRSIKVELNDTNRPDLWSTAGLARLLRTHQGGVSRAADYERMIPQTHNPDAASDRLIRVDPQVHTIRPYIAAFVISGAAVNTALLDDIIQMQEKLCWNFGQKRKAVSMGIYRSTLIHWPIHYTACNADSTSFVPLGETQPMSCRTILAEHQKGKEYGWILKDANSVPVLKDADGEILSMPPIINSAHIGAVKEGDEEMLVELTGTNLHSLFLAVNIIACNFIDFGFSILPVKIEYPFDTDFGKTIIFPQYFQKPTITSAGSVNKLLGSSLTVDEITEALTRMACTVTVDGDKIIVFPPPYRNDLLHEVDIIEDVMLGKTVDFFEPETPQDFTVGRLSPLTLLSRRIKKLFVGFGYQEMVFNYLGSKKDYIDRMNITGQNIIEIANPMSENYRFVRNSSLPGLLLSEMTSAHAVYPHRIFEIGKTAFLDNDANTGTKTVQSAGFLTAAQDANFNDAASQVASILYYLNHPYVVRESDDPRFIAGRQAEIMINGAVAGVFGELQPVVLQNWNIEVPCFAGEMIVDLL